MFIISLNSSGKSARKCKFLNYETYLVKPNVIDFDPNKIHYYPFLVSRDRCKGNCNTLPSRNNVSSKAADVILVKW